MRDYAILMIHNPIPRRTTGRAFGHAVGFHQGQKRFIEKVRFDQGACARHYGRAGRQGPGLAFYAQAAVKAGIIPSENILYIEAVCRKVDDQIAGRWTRRPFRS